MPVAPAGFDMPRWFRIIERDPFVRALLASPLPAARARSCARVVGQAYRTLAFARRGAVAAEVVSSFTAPPPHARDGRRLPGDRPRLLPELHDCFDLREGRACPSC